MRLRANVAITLRVMSGREEMLPIPETRMRLHSASQARSAIDGNASRNGGLGSDKLSCNLCLLPRHSGSQPGIGGKHQMQSFNNVGCDVGIVRRD